MSKFYNRVYGTCAKAYLFHTTSIFNFVQIPVADKYTDILYMRTLLFPPIFHGKSITLGRG